MRKVALLTMVCAALAAAAAVASSRAEAADTMTISCGGEPVEVLVQPGYALHVVGSRRNLVITSLSVFNETLGGTHVLFELHGFDANSIQEKTCTWTATASNGSTSTFTAVGFFTPATV